MDLLRWKDSYAVGVPIIDRQHKQLFALIDELRCEMDNGDARHLIPKVFSRLSDYTLYHFSSEELLMKRYEFPEFETHKVKHEYFRQELANLVIRHDNGDSTVSVDAYIALRDWIFLHVTSVEARADQHLAAHIKAHEAGVDAFEVPEEGAPSSA